MPRSAIATDAERGLAAFEWLVVTSDAKDRGSSYMGPIALAFWLAACFFHFSGKCMAGGGVQFGSPLAAGCSASPPRAIEWLPDSSKRLFAI